MERAWIAAFFLLVCALGASAQSSPSMNATSINCTSDPPPCGWNAQCNDTEWGPQCYCETGYWLNSTNDCEMCPWGTWGWNCTFECNCTTIVDNTTTCDHVNGSCPDDGLYNCYDDPCGGALCRNVNETFECYCADGYWLVNETECEECPWNTWGYNCTGYCNCTDNTTTCNPATGICPEDEMNCESNPCGANAQCMDISLGNFRCYCTTGYLLIDDYWCMKCPAGLWGANCTESCDCGQGNSCDNIDGECICNDCWTGEDCDISVGADCVFTFLTEADKCENNLMELFGGVVYPRQPDGTLTSLVVDMMELDNSVVIQTEPDFEGVSREDVDQGPLVKLTWTVDKNADRPNANTGLEKLAERVKLGTIRSTLIINSREDSADVTLNSGVRRCEDSN